MLLPLIAPVTLAIAWLVDKSEGDELSVADGPRYGTPIERWCPSCRGESCEAFGGWPYAPETGEIDREADNPYWDGWERWEDLYDDAQQHVEEAASQFHWGLMLNERRYGRETFLEMLFDEPWPWNDRIPWRPLMPIDGSTWDPFDPFPEIEPIPWPKGGGEPGYRRLVDSIRKGEHPDSDRYSDRSPDGEWVFVKQVLPRGYMLDCSYVEEGYGDVHSGKVSFDTNVVIPSIFEGNRGSPWMSMTPQEIITQVEGIDMARSPHSYYLLAHRGEGPGAHVVVGGLGLGWLLVEIAKLPGVGRVTLVERDQALCDWLLPRLCPLLPEGKPIDVVIGDAFETMKGMKADVAVMDIWPNLSDIADDMEKLEEAAPSIGYWWGWGWM